MTKSFIKEYFTNVAEYPDRVAFDPLPWGHYWTYISSTFLNGFINYVEIEAAYVLNRYHKWEEPDDPHYNREISIRDPVGSSNWVKFKGTKQEIYDKLCEPGGICHCEIDNDFGDDVVILARCKQAPGWFFFWYDQDCSDSCIGRFLTNDSDETVLAAFHSWVTQLEKEYSPAKPIPLHYFGGWREG